VSLYEFYFCRGNRKKNFFAASGAEHAQHNQDQFRVTFPNFQNDFFLLLFFEHETEIYTKKVSATAGVKYGNVRTEASSKESERVYFYSFPTKQHAFFVYPTIPPLHLQVCF
jgi:hypothetical protein